MTNELPIDNSVQEMNQETVIEQVKEIESLVHEFKNKLEYIVTLHPNGKLLADPNTGYKLETIEGKFATMYREANYALESLLDSLYQLNPRAIYYLGVLRERLEVLTELAREPVLNLGKMDRMVRSLHYDATADRNKDKPLFDLMSEKLYQLFNPFNETNKQIIVTALMASQATDQN